MSTPKIKEPVATYQRIIVNFCLNQVAMMKSRALKGCLKRTEASSAELLKGDPFSFQNLMVVVTHVPTSTQIVQSLGAFWLGLKFKFPLIWLPIEDYHINYEL